MYMYSRIKLFRESLSEKVHATIPKGIVGGFEFTVHKEIWKNGTRNIWTYVIWVVYGMSGKGKQQSRFDSYGVRKCIAHIPYYLSELSRADFFPTTFLEIAVYQLGSKIKRAS